jgi:hypothetical protein
VGEWGDLKGTWRTRKRKERRVPPEHLVHAKNTATNSPKCMSHPLPSSLACEAEIIVLMLT